MQSFQEYKIFPELELVIDIYYGDLDLKGLIAFKRNQVLDHAFSPLFDLISDSRKSILHFEPGDVEKYAEFVLQAGDVIGNRKTAFLAEKPMQVVMATLFERVEHQLPHTFRVFSTVSAAIKWIGKPGFTEEDYHQVFEDLLRKGNRRT